MPVPLAILGLPALGAFLGSLTTGLVNFFVIFLTRKLAIRTVGIIAIVAATATMVLAVQATLETIEYAIPASIQLAASWILPTNFELCLTAYFGALATRWAYDWNVRVIQLKLF